MEYFGFLALFSVAGLVGAALRSRSPRVGAGLLCLAAAGFVAALVWQVFRVSVGDRPSPVDRHSAALAYFLGHAAVGDIAAQPGTVAIVLPAETARNRTTLNSLFDTVARVLSPIPGIEIREVTIAARAPEIQRGDVPLADFTNALAGVPNLTAWFSFVGVPRDLASAAPSPGRGYVYDPSGGMAWVEPLKAGRLQRVVVPRPEADADEARPSAGPPDEIFAAHFLMATPANADAVAERLRPRKGQ
ncbi:MAG: hypothetical protein IPM17_14430 [Verrucomicrobia bacterium]|jgi:hypothetical protein|nr:hypothetical protein [Verrucomicrobiota bacterium]